MGLKVQLAKATMSFLVCSRKGGTHRGTGRDFSNDKSLVVFIREICFSLVIVTVDVLCDRCPLSGSEISSG